MGVKASDLWIMRTSNNPGTGLHEIFTHVEEAQRALQLANKYSREGRHDWIIESLEDAIEAACRERESR